MASRYGAVTPEQLNAFKLEDVGELMALDYQETLNKVTMIDSILEIPRRMFSFQCAMKPHESGSMARKSKRLRERLYQNPYDKEKRKPTGEVTVDMKEAVAKRFGITFMEPSNG